MSVAANYLAVTAYMRRKRQRPSPEPSSEQRLPPQININGDEYRLMEEQSGSEYTRPYQEYAPALPVSFLEWYRKMNPNTTYTYEDDSHLESTYERMMPLREVEDNLYDLNVWKDKYLSVVDTIKSFPFVEQVEFHHAEMFVGNNAGVLDGCMFISKKLYSGGAFVVRGVARFRLSTPSISTGGCECQ